MHTPLHSEVNFRALPNCEPPISNPLSKTHTPFTCWHGFWMQESKTAVHMVSVCELPHVIFFSNANHYIITAIFPFCNIMFACLFIVNIFFVMGLLLHFCWEFCWQTNTHGFSSHLFFSCYWLESLYFIIWMWTPLYITNAHMVKWLMHLCIC